MKGRRERLREDIIFTPERESKILGNLPNGEIKRKSQVLHKIISQNITQNYVAKLLARTYIMSRNFSG